MLRNNFFSHRVQEDENSANASSPDSSRHWFFSKVCMNQQCHNDPEQYINRIM